MQRTRCARRRAAPGFGPLDRRIARSIGCDCDAAVAGVDCVYVAQCIADGLCASSPAPVVRYQPGFNDWTNAECDSTKTLCFWDRVDMVDLD